MDVERKAWLVMCAGDDREHGGNDGYADQPEFSYLWDSRVGNHGKIKKHDWIVLRNKRSLLGASIIEDIERCKATKDTYKCPGCLKADFGPRTTMPQRYKCNDVVACGARFNDPIVVPEEVETYRSHHGAGWIDLRGRLSGKQLHALCTNGNARLSLRELRWDAFQRAIGESLAAEYMQPLNQVAARIAGGHKDRTVRGRIGQAQFRDDLLEQTENPVCALTGPAPVSVLEAGHLYSYAAEGEHYEDGGLLMRRDIHTLFDSGHLAINPSTWTIDVSPHILSYEAYGLLHGQSLHVCLRPGHKKWLEQHWAKYRGRRSKSPEPD